MTPDSAHTVTPRRSASDSESLAADDQAAVETFMFEVTAGKKLARPVANNDDNALAVRVDLPHVVDNPTPRSQVVPTKKIVRQTVTPQVRPISFNPIKKQRSMPPLMGSILFHAAVILPMGFVTITSFEHPFDFSLSLSTEPAMADEVMISEIEIDPLENFDNLDSQVVNEVAQTTVVATSDLSTETALADLSSASLADAALSDVSSMFGAHGSGLAEMVPSGEQLTASFFGTKVDGRRILYVLDNSGGMKDGEFETLVDELLRSIESLTPEQEFYVVFYSDRLYPLFHPRPVERFVPANDRFKQRLRAWLETVEFSMGNTVDQAIQSAAAIRPDAVYLLTDGDVNTTQDGRKLAALLDTRGREFPIHTFGIGMSEQTQAADNLRQVAEANHGTFRAVEVSPEAKARAREKKRPYHNKEPGREWGLNVGRGWGR